MNSLKYLEEAIGASDPIPGIVAAAELLSRELPPDQVAELNGYLGAVLHAVEKGRITAARRLVIEKLLPMAKQRNSMTEAEITRAIQDQYTRYMYPDKWEGRLPANFATLRSEALHNVDLVQHLAFPRYIPHSELEVLNAGCGTGESLVIAAREFPAVRFTAVDISEASLARAQGYADTLGIKNIEFIHANLMTLELGRQFDIIQSSGVIHHLADPAAGLRQLKKHLKPIGAMSLFVYAKFGRFELELMVKALKILQGGAFTVGPREAKNILLSLNNNARAKNIAFKDDVYEGDQHIVDLLLNANEKYYTVSEFDATLREAGLYTLDLLVPNTYNPLTYTDNALVKAKAAALPVVERAQLAELFSGNISKHFVVATHAGNYPAMPHADDAGLPDYVPYPSPYAYVKAERRNRAYHLTLEYNFLLETVRTFTAVGTRLDPLAYEIFTKFDGSRSLRAVYDEYRIDSNSYWGLVKNLVDRNLIYLHSAD